MKSCPITSWKIQGEKKLKLTDFIFLGSKISVNGDFSPKIKGHLLLRKKPITNLYNVLRSKDISLLTKFHTVKALIFPAVVSMWELNHKEGWWLKKWCFQTVVLEKTLESHLDSKEIKPVNPKGNQPWIFTGRTWCWSWNSNTLAIWCRAPTHWKRPWCWERLKARGERDDREWDVWMASPIQWTWVWANSRILWRTGKSGVLQSMG